MRDPIPDPVLEAEATSCGSMKALRAKPHLREAWTLAMEPVTKFLGCRIARQYLTVRGKREYFTACNKRSDACVEVLHALGKKLCPDYSPDFCTMSWTDYEGADKAKTATEVNTNKGVSPREAGQGGLSKCFNKVNAGLRQSTYRLERYAGFDEREADMSPEVMACLQTGVPLPMKENMNDEHYCTSP
jgi:hypothetical protein